MTAYEEENDAGAAGGPVTRVVELLREALAVADEEGQPFDVRAKICDALEAIKSHLEEPDRGAS